MPDEIRDSSTTPEELAQTYAAMLGEETPSPPVSTATGAADVTPPPPMRIIEALLFVGGAPLTAKRAREILRGLTEDAFDEAITQLNTDYRRQTRPYVIQPQGHGWVLTLRPKYRHVVEKLYGGVREARLSNAAIDVLALVAYSQPVTKPDIDTVRGADSGSLLRQLVRRGLIQIVPMPGAKPKEVVYATTPRFLEMFGLQNLDDLPKTHDLQQMCRLCSRHDLLNHMPMHIGQAAVDAVVAERQARVIDAEQVQHRRVNVVAIRRMLGRAERPLVAGPVGDAALDAAAGEPVCERERVVIAAQAALAARHTAELGRPHHDRVVEQAAAFQVLEEGGGRAVHAGAHVVMIALQVFVRIPVAAWEAVVGAGPDLHEAHAQHPANARSGSAGRTRR